MITQLLNTTARRVIESAPLSTELLNFSSTAILRKTVEPLDSKVQQWALNQSDRFQKGDWDKVQFTKLKALLEHAQRTVPYWGERFKDADFDPQRMRSVTEVSRIPVLTRSQIKNIDIHELVSGDFLVRRGKEARTSGSTNEPLRFFQDRRDLFRRRINTVQELRYGAGTTGGTDPLVIGLEHHPDLADFKNRFLISQLEDETVRRNEIYSVANLYRPILITGASALLRLHWLESYDCVRTTFRAIFYRGEHISEPTRNALSKFFGCSIYTTYGSSECSLLGIECEHHQLHTAPWMNYFEILDDNHQSVSLGEYGYITVTFLENYVMPFIRYRIGDMGAIHATSCLCGRSTPTFTFKGREQAMITLPNEVQIPLINLIRYIDERFGKRIFRYQFVEIPGHQIVFRYMPIGEPSSVVETKLSAHFSSQLQGFYQVVCEPVAKILPNANGKTPLFVKGRMS